MKLNPMSEPPKHSKTVLIYLERFDIDTPRATIGQFIRPVQSMDGYWLAGSREAIGWTEIPEPDIEETE